MKNELNQIIGKQIEFQEILNIDINTIVENDRNRIGENYIYKGIEEFVELRRTFPSVINADEKNPRTVDMVEVMNELSDVALFLLNFMVVFRITPEELLNHVPKVQENNFLKKKEKEMARLNHEIMRSPALVVGIGGGNIFPKYIFVGQNPAQTMKRGHTFYSVNEGSGKILLDIIDNLGIRDQCYFTNLVKETTENNAVPPQDMIIFWRTFLHREIEILNWGCENKPIIIPIGSVSQKNLGYPGIIHPSYVMRGGITEEEYAFKVAAFIAGVTNENK